MTAERDSSTVASSTRGSGFLHFVENAFAVVLCLLMAAGLIAITATWRSNTIEFVGKDRMRITETKWWGMRSEETLYRSTVSGWAVMRPNGDEVPVASQPIRLAH